MATYDFSNLESKFADVVNQMSDIVDSHEFLLALAQKNQVEYIKALYAYKDNKKSTPFKEVLKAIIQKFKKTHRVGKVNS